MNNKRLVKILFELVIEVFVFALILMICSSLFENFYVSSFWQAVIAALIISVLNATIKPLLEIIMLPVTIMSLGILYPIINVIILKITSWILVPNFIVSGFIIPFFIAIFISILKMILGSLIVEPIKRRV